MSQFGDDRSLKGGDVPSGDMIKGRTLIVGVLSTVLVTYTCSNTQYSALLGLYVYLPVWQILFIPWECLELQLFFFHAATEFHSHRKKPVHQNSTTLTFILKSSQRCVHGSPPHPCFMGSIWQRTRPRCPKQHVTSYLHISVLFAAYTLHMRVCVTVKSC